MAARLLRVGVMLAAAAVLAGCAPAATVGAPAATPPASSDPSATAPGSSEPPAEPVELTCESMLSAGLVAGYAAQGWTAVSNPLYIGSTLIPDGMSCTWGNHAGEGNDIAQVFGYGTLTPELATQAQADLAAQGWTTEEDPSGVLVTEPRDGALITDADGYGMSYLFGEGWVRLADTREALILVVWPR
ncbi:hypothetical protein [Microbacterium sp. ZW T5_56]|uniref:hypothetical protein n=1 Tax=Microbacterium sp. ZW T5_56 TaxID=3378081 RepID=UPI003852993B